MTAGPQLETSEIQGYILREYGLQYSRYCFIQFLDSADGRRWIGRIVPRITTSGQWDPIDQAHNPAATLNIAFTADGLKAVGISADSMKSFSTEFQEGAFENDRATSLGDTGDSAPSAWEEGFGDPQQAARLHALLILCGHTAADIETQWKSIEQTFGPGVQAVYSRDGNFFPDGTEHFGYRDGIGQPAIEGSGEPDYPGRGLPQPDGTWKPLAAGEFLFGYPTELGVPNRAPFLEIDGRRQVSRNSTYLAYRKLKQDVIGFRQFLSATASQLKKTDEWVAAKLVGRWRDGTPVELSPDHPDPALASDAARNNDFRYGNDLKGLRVPIGSHLRRMNPRDGVAGGNGAVSGHRIIRRGTPYGTQLPLDATASDREDRGIVFIAIVNSLMDQFEFLQQEWINSGSFFKLDPSQKDPLLGDNDGTSPFVIPMPDFPRRTPNLARFVTTQFASYLFFPSIADLGFLKLDG
ncbi:MAG: peroxidase [Planctomycetes bacterium]|nr:peroxidase [Planctomycetota bacterium]